MEDDINEYDMGYGWLKFCSNKKEYPITPRFYVNDPDAEILGQIKDLKEPGLVVKKFGNSISIFSAAPFLPSPVIRNILKEAGVHIYSNEEDQVYANSGYVGFTSLRNGKRKLLLPDKYDIYDAFTGKKLAGQVGKYEFTAKRAETRLFRLA